jgi:nucleosome binding factor SPN SPT16 subunit
VLRKVYTSATSLTIAKHLETLVGKDPSGVPLEILKRSKDEEVNRKTFSDITDAIKAAGVYPKLDQTDNRNELES